MVTRTFGIVTSEKDPKRWMREQSLGTGPGIASDPMPRRYSSDPVDAHLYQAERLLRLRMQNDPEWQGYEPWFVDLEHAQVYVDLALTRAGAQWNTGPVQVRASRWPAAHYWGGIYLPERDRRWMRGLIVLHETAHHMTQTRHDHHGERFIDAFGELLEVMYEPAVRGLFLTYLDEAKLTG